MRVKWYVLVMSVLLSMINEECNSFTDEENTNVTVMGAKKILYKQSLQVPPAVNVLSDYNIQRSFEVVISGSLYFPCVLIEETPVMEATPYGISNLYTLLYNPNLNHLSHSRISTIQGLTPIAPTQVSNKMRHVKACLFKYTTTSEERKAATAIYSNLLEKAQQADTVQIGVTETHTSCVLLIKNKGIPILLFSIPELQFENEVDLYPVLRLSQDNSPHFLQARVEPEIDFKAFLPSLKRLQSVQPSLQCHKEQ